MGHGLGGQKRPKYMRPYVSTGEESGIGLGLDMGFYGAAPHASPKDPRGVVLLFYGTFYTAHMYSYNAFFRSIKLLARHIIVF
jgi:hypothetical protein